MWAASEGNHGRAVARAAAQRGLAARIFLPAATSASRAEAIASEGAEVVRVAGRYEDAVAAAGEAAAEPGRGDARRRRVRRGGSGLAMGRGRVLDDLRRGRRAGRGPFDVVLCQIGVGAFASAAIRFACHQTPPAVAIGVEPANAACATASLAAGRPVVVDAPGTSMAGLNCATPSHAAWPTLRDGLLGCVVISDEESRTRHARPGRAGHRRGRLRRRARWLRCARSMRDPECAELARARRARAASRVLLVSTEGATDPVSYAETVERT